MMTSSVTSALAISVLLQIVRQTCAQDPTRIFLILDNNDFDQRYKPILKGLTNAPIELRHDGVHFSESIPPKVKEAGHKILYISAKFSEDEKGEKLTWGAGKTAKDLATIISEIFSGSQELFVTVVFPEICLKTIWGYEFVATFEAKVQESNRNIGIRIPRVKIYLFVNQARENIEGEINKTPVSNTIWDNTMNSIFFKLEGNKLVLYSPKENLWIQKPDGRFDSVFKGLQKMKIEEAESITVVIKADCGNKYSESNVAEAVSSILATKRHEQQRIKIELNCPSNYAGQEQQLSNSLIKILKNKLDASIYGVKPSVVIHLFIDEFFDNVKSTSKTRHSTHLYARYIGTKKYEVFPADPNTGGKTPIEVIRSAAEVSLQVNCHSNFESSAQSKTICGMSADQMAQSIKNLFSDIDGSALDEKRIELVLYACVSGTSIGKIYVKSFLHELKKLYAKPIIDEVISFAAWTTQYNGLQFTVPLQSKCDADYILNDNNSKELKSIRQDMTMWQLNHVMYAHEHNIYGRFTIRTKWDGTEYITFPVLPATEYGVYKLKIPRS